MDSILSYALSFTTVMQQIGAWCVANPEAAAVLGGLILELVAKYSPWKGSQGLVELIGRAVVKAAKRGK